jgi:hypothetical protein
VVNNLPYNPPLELPAEGHEDGGGAVGVEVRVKLGIKGIRS